MQLGTRELIITIGGVDYSAEIGDTEIRSAPAPAGFVTHAAARAGGARQYTVAFNAIQDPATGTVWRKVWDSAGTTAAYIIKPAGGTTPSVTQPHFTGNLTITEPDGVILGGGTDSEVSARFTVALAWVCTAKPTMLTA